MLARKKNKSPQPAIVVLNANTTGPEWCWPQRRPPICPHLVGESAHESEHRISDGVDPVDGGCDAGEVGHFLFLLVDDDAEASVQLSESPTDLSA